MNDMSYRTRPEAAEFLLSQGFPITKGTLGKLACIGGGPAYQKFGKRVLYKESDLLGWATSRLSAPITNTSQQTKPA